MFSDKASTSGTLNPFSPSSQATVPTLRVHATRISLATVAIISTLNGSSDFKSSSTCFPRLCSGKVMERRVEFDVIVAYDTDPRLDREERRTEGLDTFEGCRRLLRASDRGQWVSLTAGSEVLDADADLCAAIEAA